MRWILISPVTSLPARAETDCGENRQRMLAHPLPEVAQGRCSTIGEEVIGVSDIGVNYRTGSTRL